MRTILAIDPGTTQSAVVVWNGSEIHHHEILPNEDVFDLLDGWTFNHSGAVELVIEQIRNYGMAVGKETFDTVFWAGRFAERWSMQGGTFHQMPRQDVKLFWCKTARAKDTNIWAAMCDRFGQPGTKANPGTLYGIKSHERAALALAIAFAEREQISTP